MIFQRKNEVKGRKIARVSSIGKSPWCDRVFSDCGCFILLHNTVKRGAGQKMLWYMDLVESTCTKSVKIYYDGIAGAILVLNHAAAVFLK